MKLFVNMSVGYFDKTGVRTKFQKCGEDELYEVYYEYTTNFVTWHLGCS